MSESYACKFKRKLKSLEIGLRKDRGLIKKELGTNGYTPKLMRLCSDWADNFYDNMAILKAMRKHGEISTYDCEAAKGRLREAAFGNPKPEAQPAKLPEPKTPGEAATALATSKAEAPPTRFFIQSLSEKSK